MATVCGRWTIVDEVDHGGRCGLKGQFFACNAHIFHSVHFDQCTLTAAIMFHQILFS